MECDYKLKSVTRDGKTTKVRAVVYYGETSERVELDGDGNMTPRTRYRRSEKYEDHELTMGGTVTDEEVASEMKARLASASVKMTAEKNEAVTPIEKQRI